VVGLPLAAELHRRGFHVFLYDSRSHGDSGGTHCTYGFYEKHDASAVISYLCSRTDITVGRIGLFGTSMGAAVALQVAAMDPRVSAVVAESGFATLRSVFDDYQKRMIKRSEHLAHFKANAVSPLDAVAGIHIPLLISHGTADDRIKCVYSESVYRRANEPKELTLIPGAKHHNMAEMGGAAYQQKILSFFERNL
jgi:fermentation-respiration switch protein FrsA (DUF1100 family)